MELVIASANKHKIEEFSAILSCAVTLYSSAEAGVTEDIPETADTLEGNALLKARYIYAKTGRNCFADDTGLEVDALDGAPGVHSARYSGDDHDMAANVRLLMRNMEGVANRHARFRTVIALILDGNEHLFEGTVEGQITAQASGSDGFGYDPIFCPDGERLTFAQMSAPAKNAISHRGRAASKLADFLRCQ